MTRLRRVLAAALSALIWGAAQASATRLKMLTGYWTGLGTVTLTSGGVETVKCVATYKNIDEVLRQSLRCANASQTINASAELVVKGGMVTGTWDEKTFAAVGSIAGRVTDDGLTLTIQGSAFSAEMTVAATECTQVISILPSGLNVTEITIDLRKMLSLSNKSCSKNTAFSEKMIAQKTI